MAQIMQNIFNNNKMKIALFMLMWTLMCALPIVGGFVGATALTTSSGLHSSPLCIPSTIVADGLRLTADNAAEVLITGVDRAQNDDERSVAQSTAKDNDPSVDKSYDELEGYPLKDGRVNADGDDVDDDDHNVDEDVADVWSLLPQELIYNFAIKFKKISRVTFFTCQPQLQATSVRNSVNNNKSTNKKRDGERREIRGKNADDADDADNRQQTTLNMNTMEILQRMYTKIKITPITSAKGSKTENNMKESNENIEISAVSRQWSNASDGTASATTVATTKPTTTRRMSTAGDLRGILIKVEQIDQLINRRRTSTSSSGAVSSSRSSMAASSNSRSTPARNNHANAQRTRTSSGDTAGGGAGRTEAGGGGGGGGRYTYTNANWLEQVLRAETLRQIVVLNLSCGPASRRLLEMASNKALFNSTYHWLLIEDYAYNRQSGSDDSNDSGSNNNNDDDNDNQNSNDNRQRNESINNNNNSKNVDSNKEAARKKILNTPGISSTSANVNSITIARAVVKFKPTSSYAPLPDVGKYVNGGKRPQQSQSQQQRRRKQGQQNLIGNTDKATDAWHNEDNMEIIEKLLEKINININTELILANRMQSLPPSPSQRLYRTDGGNKPIDDDNNSNSNKNKKGKFKKNSILQKKDYYALYDVWNPGQQYGGQLNISEIGNFTLDDGFQIAESYRRSTTITRRMDMKMVGIRCLIVITHKNRTDTLEHYLTTHYDTHLDSMNRFNFALLSHVRDLFNFSFILSKTSTWGYLKNGKFDGMIGALVRKQADIGGSPIFFRVERAKVIDYTTRTWVARPCFIFRHPRSTKKDRIVFLQPFSNMVWIFLGLCGIITILLLWMLTTFESKLTKPGEAGIHGSSWRQRHRQRQTNNVVPTATIRDADAADAAARDTDARANDRNGSCDAAMVVAVANGDACAGCVPRIVSWGNVFCGHEDTDNAVQHRVGLFLESVLFYIGSICQQGLSIATNFISGRCIVITSLLFAFSIYQFYSASIVGTLLMEKPKTIRTLRDLIHSSLEIGVEDIVYNRDYFLRTKDPDAIELYAKKVTSVPTSGDQGFLEIPATPTPTVELSAAAKAKTYREILHSHETGAHAKTNEASNWYEPEYGVAAIKRGKFAFHVDVATAYRIISDTFTEKEICDLTEIQLFPPQKMVSIVQKGSPLKKMITYGLRRVTEAGLMDYQRKVWHSPKPRCVKRLQPEDLRVDMQTFASALLVLIFGYAASLLTLIMEIMHHKLWQRYAAAT